MVEGNKGGSGSGAEWWCWDEKGMVKEEMKRRGSGGAEAVGRIEEIEIEGWRRAGLDTRAWKRTCRIKQ